MVLVNILTKIHIIDRSFEFCLHFAGDPDNKSLRRVEIEVLIPKIMRDRTRTEKCIPQVVDFEKCCKASGISMVVKCRKENAELKDCLTKWYQDEKFKAECTQMYLDQRSEYRKTGINAKQKAAAETEAAKKIVK